MQPLHLYKLPIYQNTAQKIFTRSYEEIFTRFGTSHNKFKILWKIQIYNVQYERQVVYFNSQAVGEDSWVPSSL